MRVLLCDDGYLEASPREPFPGDRRAVSIDYTNHRGERSIRTVIPTGRLIIGGSKWHLNAPYLFEMWDAGKDAFRLFDPSNIHRWSADTLPAHA